MNDRNRIEQLTTNEDLIYVLTDYRRRSTMLKLNNVMLTRVNVKITPHHRTNRNRSTYEVIRRYREIKFFEDQVDKIHLEREMLNRTTDQHLFSFQHSS